MGASAVILGDRLTPYNVGGLVLCVCGIGMYNWYQLQRARELGKT